MFLFFFFKIDRICKKCHQTILGIKFFGSLKLLEIIFYKIELKKKLWLKTFTTYETINLIREIKSNF